MLILRKPQLAALQGEVDAQFCRQMVRLLRTELSAHVADLGDAQIERRCAQALERVDRYGLAHDRDVVAFVTLTFTMSADFDAHPAFNAILSNPRWDGNEKMRRLFTVDTRHFAEATRKS